MAATVPLKEMSSSAFKYYCSSYFSCSLLAFQVGPSQQLREVPSPADQPASQLIFELDPPATQAIPSAQAPSQAEVHHCFAC